MEAPTCSALLDEQGYLTAEQLSALVAADDPRAGSWFHGSSRCFDGFELDPDERSTYDWNAFLGVHFCRDLAYTADVFCFDGGWVYETRLGIANPARYGSEFDLDRLALQLLAEEGFDPETMIASHELFIDDSDEVADRYRNWVRTGDGERFDPHCVFRSITLNDSSADANVAALLVREHLERLGHDGIVYGNAIDFSAVCAIAFDPGQITVVRRTGKDLLAAVY